MERKELQSHDALAIWGAVDIREANGKTYDKEFYWQTSILSYIGHGKSTGLKHEAHRL